MKQRLSDISCAESGENHTGRQGLLNDDDVRSALRNLTETL